MKKVLYIEYTYYSNTYTYTGVHTSIHTHTCIHTYIYLHTIIHTYIHRGLHAYILYTLILILKSSDAKGLSQFFTHNELDIRETSECFINMFSYKHLTYSE